MFTKLQLYILIVCILAAGAVLAVMEYRQKSPSDLFWASTPAPASDAGTAPNQQDSGDVNNETANADANNDSSSADSEQKPQKPSAALLPDDPSDDKAIDAVMDKLATTCKAGDYTYAVDVMYTPILDAGGGKEKALEDARSFMEWAKAQQIIYVSWKTKKPYEYLAGTSHKYAIISSETVMKYGDKTLRQTSYQLGVKTVSGWQFVDGVTLTQDFFDQYFPDFPKDVELPKVKRNFE